MALPKIDMPTYDFTIPSNGKTIKVRPFSVKEEKLLLIALESKNPDEIVNTVKQVVNNCAIDVLDMDKLPFFDIDFLFIFLRAKSIGDTVEVSLTCNNMVENEPCGKVFPTSLNIANVQMIRDETIVDKIPLDKDKGVKMKYPSYAKMQHIDQGNPVDYKTNVIISAIEHIYDKNGIYPARDHSTEELKEFVEGLSEANYKKLEDFVDNFPTFAVKLEADCPKCGFHHSVRYSDFYDFFT